MKRIQLPVINANILQLWSREQRVKSFRWNKGTPRGSLLNMIDGVFKAGRVKDVEGVMALT